MSRGKETRIFIAGNGGAEVSRCPFRSPRRTQTLYTGARQRNNRIGQQGHKNRLRRNEISRLKASAHRHRESLKPTNTYQPSTDSSLAILVRRIKLIARAQDPRSIFAALVNSCLVEPPGNGPPNARGFGNSDVSARRDCDRGSATAILNTD